MPSYVLHWVARGMRQRSGRRWSEVQVSEGSVTAAGAHGCRGSHKWRARIDIKAADAAHWDRGKIKVPNRGRNKNLLIRSAIQPNRG